jgi:cyclase
MFRHLAVIRTVAAVAALAATAVAQAQPAPDPATVEIRTTRLAEGVHILEGQGGTITALTGPEGVLLVDSQFAALTDKLVAAVRTLSDRPIRFLVNTHLHGDHTGGNENFARQGALIFARDQLRSRLMRPGPTPTGAPVTPAPAGALPVVTYDGPTTIHLNGEEVRLIPIRAAHTDGDTLIHFVKADVLAVGDYYRSVGFPRVDLNSGGTLDGLLAGLGETIGRAGPETKIVPGHGPVVDRATLVAHRDQLLAIRDELRPMVASGMTVEAVLAAKPLAMYEASVPQGAQTAEQFVRWLYAELKRTN